MIYTVQFHNGYHYDLPNIKPDELSKYGITDKLTKRMLGCLRKHGGCVTKPQLMKYLRSSDEDFDESLRELNFHKIVHINIERQKFSKNLSFCICSSTSNITEYTPQYED